jgi:glycosyltransferase involved in cell wall biosynthesis
VITKPHYACDEGDFDDMKKRKTFYLLSPRFRDSQFTKAEGIIPYVMQKHHGYQAVYAMYHPPIGHLDLFSLKAYTEDVTIDYIQPSFLFRAEDSSDNVYATVMHHVDECSQDLVHYIERKAHHIDVLYLSGFYAYYYDAVIRYKEIKPKGKVYLKLDANLMWVNKTALEEKFIEFLRHCDLITSETQLVRYINQKWPVPVHYIPNGFYSFSTPSNDGDRFFSFEDKEDIILTVGRLGTWQKATDVLLEAFRLVVPYVSASWKLILVGSVEEEFQPYLRTFFEHHPDLKERIVFTGFLLDKDRLRDWYKKAKIFVLPSRLEVLANVYLEAKAHGCYLVLSDIESSRDVASEFPSIFDPVPVGYDQLGMYGSFFPVDDTQTMAERLLEACNDEERLKSVCYSTQEDVERRFDWIKLCKKIDILLYM